MSLSLLPIYSPQDDVTDAGSPCLSPELLALQDALYVIYIIFSRKEYVYKKHSPEAVIHFTSEESDKMTAKITYQVVNQKSKYAGEWQSCHVINGKTCTSTVTSLAHLFEEGNFQLRASQSSSFDLGDSLVDQIDAFETKAQQTIDTAFEEEIVSNSVKKLRRHLPLTRSKIDWYAMKSHSFIGPSLQLITWEVNSGMFSTFTTAFLNRSVYF